MRADSGVCGPVPLQSGDSEGEGRSCRTGVVRKMLVLFPYNKRHMRLPPIVKRSSK